MIIKIAADKMNALKTLIDNVTEFATDVFTYSECVSEFLGLDPEEWGWFYRRGDNGVEVVVTNGICRPGVPLESWLKEIAA